MDKVDRLRSTVEPFDAVFWGSRHCTCQHRTLAAVQRTIKLRQSPKQLTFMVTEIKDHRTLKTCQTYRAANC